MCVLYLMHIPRMLAHQRAQLPACSRHLPHIASPTCSWHSASPSTHCCASSAAAPHAGVSQQGSSQEPCALPQAPHIPVLLRPILECFQPLKMRSYVDGTLGAGGHACAMLQAHPVSQGRHVLLRGSCRDATLPTATAWLLPMIVGDHRLSLLVP